MKTLDGNHLALPMGEQEKQKFLEEFVCRMEKSAIHYARKFTSKGDLAEEAFVEACVVLWKKFDQILGEADNLESYFMGIVKYASYDLMRQSPRHVSLERLDEDFGWEPARFSEPAYGADFDLQQAISSLDSTSSFVLKMVQEGMTTLEIADEFAVSRYEALKLRVKARVSLMQLLSRTELTKKSENSTPQDYDPSRWWTLTELVIELGQCKRWVLENLAEFRSEAEIRPILGKRLTLFYPDRVRCQLVDRIIHYPLAEEKLSAVEIGYCINRSGFWVKNRLAELGIPGEDRLSRKNSRVLPHWTFDELQKLRDQISGVTENSDDLTIEQLMKRLDRGRKWVVNRLKQMKITGVKKRNPKSGNIEMFYPVSVSSKLKSISDTEIPAGCWWPIGGRTEEYLGHQSPWIKRRLLKIGAQPQNRTAVSGKVSPHYPPCAIMILKFMADEDS